MTEEGHISPQEADTLRKILELRRGTPLPQVTRLSRSQVQSVDVKAADNWQVVRPISPAVASRLRESLLNIRREVQQITEENNQLREKLADSAGEPVPTVTIAAAAPSTAAARGRLSKQGARVLREKLLEIRSHVVSVEEENTNLKKQLEYESKKNAALSTVEERLVGIRDRILGLEAENKGLKQHIGEHKIQKDLHKVIAMTEDGHISPNEADTVRKILELNTGAPLPQIARARNQVKFAADIEDPSQEPSWTSNTSVPPSHSNRTPPSSRNSPATPTMTATTFDDWQSNQSSNPIYEEMSERLQQWEEWHAKLMTELQHFRELAVASEAKAKEGEKWQKWSQQIIQRLRGIREKAASESGKLKQYSQWRELVETRLYGIRSQAVERERRINQLEHRNWDLKRSLDLQKILTMQADGELTSKEAAQARHLVDVPKPTVKRRKDIHGVEVSSHSEKRTRDLTAIDRLVKSGDLSGREAAFVQRMVIAS